MDPGWEPLLCKAHKTSIFPCVVVHLKHFHLFSSEFSHPSLTFLSLGRWNISRRNSIPELHTHNKVIVYSGTTCNTAWAQLQRGHPSPWQHPPKCPVLGRVVMSTWGLNWSCRDEEKKVTRVPGRLVWGRLTEQSSFCHHDVPNLYDSVSVDVQMFNSAVELQLQKTVYEEQKWNLSTYFLKNLVILIHTDANTNTKIPYDFRKLILRISHMGNCCDAFKLLI